MQLVNNGQRIEYTPAAGFTGDAVISYAISDGNGGTDTATVTVTIRDFVPSRLAGFVYFDRDDDGVFDAVLSCVGVMFAPHHQQSAGELVRVTRPGGTIGLLSWTPEGLVGQMFADMKPYAPPPPPGAQRPPLWGSEEHVRKLFAGSVTELVARRQTVRVDQFATPEEFRDYFKANYGPTIAVYAGIADDPQRVAALDEELVNLAQQHDIGDGSTVMDWEYLLVTARRS